MARQGWARPPSPNHSPIRRCYDLTETPPYGPWTEIRDRIPTVPYLPPLLSAATSAATSQAAFFREALPILLIATYRAEDVTRRHPLYALLPILSRETSATRSTCTASPSAMGRRWSWIATGSRQRTRRGW